MERKELYHIAEDAVNESELAGGDIPTIDLYVDQISNLIDEKLTHGSPRFQERHLTKTMINNYSKDGLIAPIKGKKYNKEQIVPMLTVYTLKNTLSISEIKRLLDGAYAIDGFDGEALTQLYDRHLSIKEVNRTYALTALDGIMERNELNMEEDSDYITAICALTSLSAQLKNIAQAMIDARFPEETVEEKPQDVKEKKAKRKKKNQVISSKESV